ncbi:MAG: hypothetical protein ACI8YQ_003977 [Polaribacter sp.]|jgi:hypothetical protein
MTHRLILLLVLISISTVGIAQSSMKSNNTTLKGLVYNKESTFDLTLHTTGIGVAFGANFGTIKTYYKTSYYHIQIGELRHMKSNRTSPETGGIISGQSTRSFFFGKQNSLYVIRAGKGIKRYLSEKAKDKGLAIGFSYEGGLTLGLMKPYYLELVYVEDGSVNDVKSEKYSDENANVFLNNSRIYGASGITKGLTEIRPVPGVHFKIGAHFDWGAFDEMVKAVEAGVMIDVFYKKIPLMVENDMITNAENRPFFVNLYLTLQLGKRR